MTIPFRRPYSGERYRCTVAFTKPSRTKQAFKDDCDINLIIDRFAKTGVIDHVAQAKPQFIDCTNVTDYIDAMNAVNEAESAFAGLPAKVRRRFDNDPAAFLAAFDDPDMRGELAELGLLKEPPAEPVAPPASPPPDPEPPA